MGPPLGKNLSNVSTPITLNHQIHVHKVSSRIIRIIVAKKGTGPVAGTARRVLRTTGPVPFFATGLKSIVGLDLSEGKGFSDYSCKLHAANLSGSGASASRISAKRSPLES